MLLSPTDESVYLWSIKSQVLFLVVILKVIAFRARNLFTFSIKLQLTHFRIMFYSIPLKHHVREKEHWWEIS